MRILIAVGLALLLTATATAQPRHGQGGGQGRGQDHGQQGQGRGHDQGQQGQGRGHDQGRDRPSRIADGDRGLIQTYFGEQFARGNCPPGLAKKNNGCQPPGQARRWSLGQPLPTGLGYPLPPDLLRRLSPPVGYSYMRVGTDILLIAAGTRMVAAGLTDLLR